MTISMLSGEQDVRDFDRDGFRGPISFVTPAEMEALLQPIETLMQQDPAMDGCSNRLMSRHMDAEVIRRIATAPAIIEALRPLLGDDIILWNSYLWNKEPGGVEIPWHQDIDYWPLEPWLTVSVWLAIDAVDVTNSCPRVIAGSHRRIYPTVASSGTAFAQQADPTLFDDDAAINMELQPGQGFLFNERCLHQSHVNRSSRRRLGMSLRYSTPMVRINHDEAPLFPGHQALLVSGKDVFGYNRYV